MKVYSGKYDGAFDDFESDMQTAYANQANNHKELLDLAGTLTPLELELTLRSVKHLLKLVRPNVQS